MCDVVVLDPDGEWRSRVVAAFESVHLAVAAFESPVTMLEELEAVEQVGCVVSEVRLPRTSGYELQACLGQGESSVPFVFVTAYPEIEFAVRALKCGAVDYLVKPVSEQVLLDTVQRTLRHREARRTLHRRMMGFGRRLESLTDRERAVLRLLLRGEMNKQIARELGVSQRTVEVHRAVLPGFSWVDGLDVG